MDRETIDDALTQRPFSPFEVVTSSGERYTIPHPDAAMLLKSKLIVQLPPQNIADRIANLSLMHITAIEEGRQAS